MWGRVRTTTAVSISSNRMLAFWHKYWKTRFFLTFVKKIIKNHFLYYLKVYESVCCVYSRGLCSGRTVTVYFNYVYWPIHLNIVMSRYQIMCLSTYKVSFNIKSIRFSSGAHNFPVTSQFPRPSRRGRASVPVMDHCWLEMWLNLHAI